MGMHFQGSQQFEHNGGRIVKKKVVVGEISRIKPRF